MTAGYSLLKSFTKWYLMQINFNVLDDENTIVSVSISIFFPALSHFKYYSSAPTSSSILYGEKKINSPLI